MQNRYFYEKLSVYEPVSEKSIEMKQHFGALHPENYGLLISSDAYLSGWREIIIEEKSETEEVTALTNNSKFNHFIAWGRAYYKNFKIHAIELFNELESIFAGRPKDKSTSKIVGLFIGMIGGGILFGLLFLILGSLIPVIGYIIGGILGLFFGIVMGAKYGRNIGDNVAQVVFSETIAETKNIYHLNYSLLKKIKKNYGLSEKIQNLIHSYLQNQKKQAESHKDGITFKELNDLIEQGCLNGDRKAFCKIALYFVEQEMRLRGMINELETKRKKDRAAYQAAFLDQDPERRTKTINYLNLDFNRTELALIDVNRDREYILDILKEFDKNCIKFFKPKEPGLSDFEQHIESVVKKEKSKEPSSLNLNYFHAVLNHYSKTFWNEELNEIESNLIILKRLDLLTKNEIDSYKIIKEKFNLAIESEESETLHGAMHDLEYFLLKYYKIIDSNNITLAKKEKVVNLIHAINHLGVVI